MWGSKMMRAAGAIDPEELVALNESGVPLENLDEAIRHLGPSMAGTRRPYRIPLRFPEIEAGMDEHGPFIRCAFELPPGAFATIVMREIMKSDTETPDPDPAD